MTQSGNSGTAVVTSEVGVASLDCVEIEVDVAEGDATEATRGRSRGRYWMV